jgi:hypothetical protein
VFDDLDPPGHAVFQRDALGDRASTVTNPDVVYDKTDGLSEAPLGKRSPWDRLRTDAPTPNRATWRPQNGWSTA